MSKLIYVFILPLFIAISVPIAIFATFTTFFAFSTLLFRALIVYAELAGVLFQSLFSSQVSCGSLSLSDTLSSHHTEGRVAPRKSRRSSAASSSSNGGQTTPKAPESCGIGVYGGGGAARDFEGKSSMNTLMFNTRR